MATGLPVAKTLIEYNCNDLEEREEEEEEKEPIDIDFTEQKAGPENTTDFRWSGVKEDEKDTLVCKKKWHLCKKMTLVAKKNDTPQKK